MRGGDSDVGGFTLIEVLVSLLIGLVLVLGAGQLGMNIFHMRASYDSISAATSLAERQFEILRDLQNPVSTLTSGSATGLTSNGGNGGPYNVTWTVSDPFPSGVTGLCPTPVSGPAQSGLKKVVIRVTIPNREPAIDVSLTSYFKVC